MVIIGLLYSTALSSKFLVKNLAIAGYFALCVLYGAQTLSNPRVMEIMMVLGCMIFLGSILNDWGDVEVDRAAGRKTIPVTLGLQKSNSEVHKKFFPLYFVLQISLIIFLCLKLNLVQ